MKSTLRTTLLVGLTLLVAACAGNKQGTGLTFSLEGTLAGAENKTLYITELTPDNGEQFRDSLRCDKNGHFQFEGTMDYQTFFCLHENEYEYIVLLPQGGEEIEITGNYGELKESYLVNGSPESRLMWLIQNQINDANLVIHDLVETDRANKETMSPAAYEKAHNETDSIFRSEYELIYMTLYNFIEDNSGSLSTLYALDAPYNRTMRVFYQESSFEVFELVLEGLEATIPDNPHTQYFKARVERARSARMLSQNF